MAPPRKYPSVKDARAAKRRQNAAWEEKAEEAGLVRVSVLVPQGREAEIKAMAAALRKAGADRKDRVQKIMGQRVVEKRRLTELDKADMRRAYEDGMSLDAIRMPGMSLQEVIDVICEDEDYNPVDVMRDLQSPGRRARFG